MVAVVVVVVADVEAAAAAAAVVALVVVMSATVHGRQHAATTRMPTFSVRTGYTPHFRIGL